MSSFKVFLATIKLHRPTRLARLARQHVYITISAAVVLVSLVSGVVYAAASNGKTAVDTQSVQAQADGKPLTTNADTANTDQGQPNQAADNKPASTGQSQPTAKPAATASTAPAARSSQKRLKVSPATVTIKAGGTATVTVATEDGKAVTMPTFSGPNPMLLTNFAAAPFKQSWSGNISSAVTSTPGTHNLQLRAQLDRDTWYYGPITVVITPTPYATVSLSQIDYDSVQDVMLFSVKLNRLYGYDKPIERIFGHTYEHDMECYGEPLDSDTYIMGCGQTGPSRPSSGTMRVNVFTSENVFNGSGSYNLPPR